MRASCAGSSRCADDAALRERWRAIKRANKLRARAIISQRNHAIAVDPDTLFDVQVKRIHEYKRQHLNVLESIARYQRLKAGEPAAVSAHARVRRQGRARLTPPPS